MSLPCQRKVIIFITKGKLFDSLRSGCKCRDGDLLDAAKGPESLAQGLESTKLDVLKLRCILSQVGQPRNLESIEGPSSQVSLLQVSQDH